MMLRVSESILYAKLQRFSCDTKIFDVIVLELALANLFFFSVDESLLCLICGYKVGVVGRSHT